MIAVPFMLAKTGAFVPLTMQALLILYFIKYICEKELVLG